LDEVIMRLERGFDHRISLYQSRLTGLDARLKSLNPLQVLQRGYAIVSDENGKIVSSVTGVQAGNQVAVRLMDGTLEAEVKQIHQDNQ